MKNYQKELLREYKKFRNNPPFMLVGRNAECCFEAAKTVLQFRELENKGVVRLRAEPEEEDYFSVYGEPDTEKKREAIIHSLETYGCYYIVSEVNSHCECCDHDEWGTADSIGMCIYNDVLSPYENCYVVGLMKAAIKQATD